MECSPMEQEIRRETLDYAPALLQSVLLPGRAEVSAADSSWCCRSRHPRGAAESPSAKIIREMVTCVLGGVECAFSPLHGCHIKSPWRL